MSSSSKATDLAEQQVDNAEGLASEHASMRPQTCRGGEGSAPHTPAGQDILHEPREEQEQTWLRSDPTSLPFDSSAEELEVSLASESLLIHRLQLGAAIPMLSAAQQHNIAAIGRCVTRHCRRIAINDLSNAMIIHTDPLMCLTKRKGALVGDQFG